VLGKSLGIREIRLTKDGGAVADLPTEHAKRLMSLQGKPSNCHSVVTIETFSSICTHKFEM
jgi:hypothetical protein